MGEGSAAEQDLDTFVTEDGERVPDHGMAAVAPLDASTEEDRADLQDAGMQAVSHLEGQAEGVSEPRAPVPLPPAESMRGAPLFSAAASLPPGPEAPQAFASLPVATKDLPSPNPEVVARLVSIREMEELWHKISELEKHIRQKINNLDLAQEMFEQLRMARGYLMGGRDWYDEAKRYVDEVEYRLSLMDRVKAASSTVGWKLFWYEMAALVVLLVGMFVLPPLIERYASLIGYSHTADAALQSILWLINGVKSTIWGGLGGVTGALYALWRHVSQDQDFDPQYSMWYYTNPIMGVVLGAFIYLVMEAGIISMVSIPKDGHIAAAPIFVLAWLSGFQQNVAYGIVRRLLKVFQVGEGPSQGSGAQKSRQTPTSPAAH